MNPIQSAEGASYSSGLHLIIGPSNKSSAKDRSDNPKGKSVDKEGALRMYGNHIRQSVQEKGFVDFLATGAEHMEAFVQRAEAGEPGEQIDLDPLATRLVAESLGTTQMPDNVDQARRILAHVDPERVAALLK